MSVAHIGTMVCNLWTTGVTRRANLSVVMTKAINTVQQQVVSSWREPATTADSGPVKAVQVVEMLFIRVEHHETF